MVSYEDLVMTNLSRDAMSLQEQHFDLALYSDRMICSLLHRILHKNLLYEVIENC